jgi:16S rRNA (cytidine1402-2'-O)-methyltransferase
VSAGRLILVATPIGNLEDLSPRAARTLAEADFWIVEDTRVSGKLASHLGLSKPMRVLNEHTNPAKIDQYAAEVVKGASAALLTDGGTPAISDPGTLLTDRLLDAGVEVDCAPGPSAVTTALALSGFFAQRFVFLGFAGRKPGDIRSLLAPYADSPLTLVLFESPFRFAKMLEVAAEVLGDRRFAVCRELTKLHQQIARGNLSDLANLRDIPQKGELTIVLEGRRRIYSAEHD